MSGVGGKRRRIVPGENTTSPRFTVGSLIGVAPGATHAPNTETAPMAPAPTMQAAGAVAAAGPVTTPASLASGEAPWAIVVGDIDQPATRAVYRADGIEALTYSNPFGQSIEQV